MTTFCNTAPRARIAWVDYAKGVCIILVVLMHSVLGVEKYTGQVSALHGFIDWARPFRMPDFFMISGLFLASRINRPLRSFTDTKVLHFTYFYLLWMTIQFIVKTAGSWGTWGPAGTVQNYAMGLIEPAGTLWFIYVLAMLFIAVRALRSVPVLVVLAGGIALETARVHTGWLAIDEFAARFVYFYAGYAFAPAILSFADRLSQFRLPVLLSGLVVWAAWNDVAVIGGTAALPVFSLVAGFAGACAVIGFGVVLWRLGGASFVRYCGANSIVIYLSFFLFMAATRTLLLKAGLIDSPALIGLVVTAAGVAGPLLMYHLVRRSSLRFLFERPSALHLSERPQARPGHMAAAE